MIGNSSYVDPEIKSRENQSSIGVYIMENTMVGNGNGNGKQLELNAYMLAPTPLVFDVPDEKFFNKLKR